MDWEKQEFAAKKYDEVFDCVCIQSERYCEEEDIVPPSPDDTDAFDRYNDYLNEVASNAISSIVDMFEDAGMTYKEAEKAFNDIAIDEFIDLDSAQF